MVAGAASELFSKSMADQVMKAVTHLRGGARWGCAGKTTLGRELARRRGRAFIDLDDAALARAGQPIAALVAAHGWQKAQWLAKSTCAHARWRAHTQIHTPRHDVPHTHRHTHRFGREPSRS